MIEIKGLKAGYENHSVLDIEKLCFEEGKISGIVGLNGSGKSTLLKAIIGLVKRNEGEVYIDGKNISQFNHRARAREIAYLPQSFPVAAMDVETLVNHGRYAHLGYSKVLSKKDRELIDYALNLTDLANKKTKVLGSLSGGERQRAYLAMVIAQDTKYLFLDEATSSLDIKHQIEFYKVLSRLANQGHGIIITSHDLPQAFSFCDEINVLVSGKVTLSGKADDIIKSRKLKEAMGINLKKTDDRDLLYKYGLCE